MQELGSAKTYGYNLIDERSIVDRHQCQMAAKFDVCEVRTMTSLKRKTGCPNAK